MSQDHSPALPINWTRATLGDVVEEKVSQSGPCIGDDFTYVDISSIDNQSKRISDPKALPQSDAPSRAKQVLATADVLVSMTRPNLNAVALVPPELNHAIGSTGFDVLRSRVAEPSWLFYIVQGNDFIQAMCRVVQGALYPAVRPRDIRSYPIPLPPLNEQRRIVGKIEELFSDLEAGVAALTRAKGNLKRYRASVLKAAVEGSLTAEWRAEHPASEPASKLLARILTERRRQWEADQLAKFTAANKQPPKNWQAKYTEPAPPDTTNSPTLPDGWCWARMELLATDAPNSIGAGPFGTIFKAHDFRPEGVPIIFLRHVQAGVYSTRKPGFMDQQKWEELFKAEYSVFGGELLVTKLGEPPGTAAIYPSGVGPAMVTPDVIKMCPRPDVVVTEFLMNYLNSRVAQSFTSGVAFGTTRLRLTLPLFKDLPVPLPPLAEQAEIIAAVSEKLSQIEAAEVAIEHSLRRAARLRQSILKQAFEGKLVPQDPTDEPASSLLKRICNERTPARSMDENASASSARRTKRGR